MKFLNFFSILMLMCSLFASNCSKYETQYEGPYSDNDSTINNQNKFLYEVILVQGGKLYASDRKFRSTKQIATVGDVQKASINYAHSKIAYKTATGNIQVIDSAGTFIASIPNTGGVKWFDWHANNQTLYMLGADQKITLYGPAVALATYSPVVVLPYSGIDIGSIAVKPDGSVLFSFSFYDGFNYQNGVYHKTAASAGASYYIINRYYIIPTRVRISEDGGVGTSTYTDVSGFNPETFYFGTYEFAPDFKIATNSAMVVSDPAGVEFICATSDFYAVYNYSNGLIFSPTNNNTFTDIDW
jgi:hypothetical protein